MKAQKVASKIMAKVVPIYLFPTKDGASNLINPKVIEWAAALVKKGAIIGTPTDTIYGLACCCQNTEALRRVFAIKGRDSLKPVAICVADIPDVFKWSRVPVSEKVLRDLLPGPVTVALERLDTLNHELNPGTSLIGIRIPNHEFIRSLCRASGIALALTSANPSSQKSSLTVDEFKDLWPHLEVVFDGGSLGDLDPHRLGSTVVDLSIEGCYRIIREGCAHQAVQDILRNKHDLKEIINK